MTQYPRPGYAPAQVLARTATKASKKVLLLCSKVFDPASLDFLTDQTIVVDETTGLITDIRTTQLQDLRDAAAIDLRQLTVMPGFVDLHVHFFVHPYYETSSVDQITRESLTERTVRAVTHAKATLLAGFTAVRDLGTEGCFEADVGLRKCISYPMGIVPGPRYFVCTRSIVSTGSYAPKTELHPSHQEVDGISGSEVVDGEDQCRAAVRRQLGSGADWIKVYADYSVRLRMSSAAPNVAKTPRPLFTRNELKAMIDTCHDLGAKICSHATTPATMKMVTELGIDSIEHGFGADVETLELMRDNGVVFLATLGAMYTIGGNTWERAKKNFKLALSVKGLKIGIGGDVCVFPHGENALEMKLMYELGMPWKEVLRAATSLGWETIRNPDWDGKAGEAKLAEFIRDAPDAPRAGDNDVPFGSIKYGYAADIIATSGDLENGFQEAVSPASIAFVMKGGKIYKKEGMSLC